MADQKLSELTELAATPASDDEIYIRDVSEAAAQESKRITIANLLAGIAGATIIVKASDDTVNNSTTLANDSELLFPIAINEVWEFTILVLSFSPATPDYKCAITVPANTFLCWLFSGRDAGGTVCITNMIVSGGSHSSRGENCVYGIIIHGIAIATDTAGNVQYQFAQNTQNVSDTKTLIGSCIIAHQLV